MTPLYLHHHHRQHLLTQAIHHLSRSAAHRAARARDAGDNAALLDTYRLRAALRALAPTIPLPPV